MLCEEVFQLLGWNVNEPVFKELTIFLRLFV